VRVVRHIQDAGAHLPTGGVDLGGEPAQADLVDVVGAHPVALRSEKQGRGPADARGRTGEEHRR